MECKSAMKNKLMLHKGKQEFHEHKVKLKKPNTKEVVLYDSTHVKLKNRQN